MKEQIIKDIINIIKTSEFYNKIQVVTQNNGEQTETFYFYDGGIGHAILLKKESGEIETIQETEDITEESIIEKMSGISSDSKVIVAGNSGDNLITVKV
jgi:inosine/xanthosine triphosphate pyrophosphatase family protein